MPGGFGIFGAVVRSFSGGAFAPAGNVVGLDLGEDDTTLSDAIHAGFEGGDEFQVDFAKG